jgi:hypothetical protein
VTLLVCSSNEDNATLLESKRIPEIFETCEQQHIRQGAIYTSGQKILYASYVRAIPQFFSNLDLIQLKKNTVFILLQHLSRARRYFSQNVRPLIKVSRVWLLQYFHFVILFFYIELILSLFFKKNADPSKLRVLHYLCFFS